MPGYDNRNNGPRTPQFDEHQKNPGAPDLNTAFFEKAPEHQRFQAMAERYVELQQSRDETRELIQEASHTPDQEQQLREQLDQQQQELKELQEMLAEQDKLVEQELAHGREPGQEQEQQRAEAPLDLSLKTTYVHELTEQQRRNLGDHRQREIEQQRQQEEPEHQR